MLVSKAIEIIRGRINDEYDTGYTDEHLINYINDSKEYLAHALIARYDSLLTKVLKVTANGTDVPKNFVKLCGGFPLRRMGKKFYITGIMPVVFARYFYTPDDVTGVGDNMPFSDNDTYNMIIINLASIYALNKHEYNVQQDTSLNEQLNQIIEQALGAIE